jgi:hypothetical protein
MLLTRDLGEDRLGWLGLNRASRFGTPGALLVHPVIGVRHQLIERDVAEGSGVKAHPYVPPSTSEPLRYLTPPASWQEWILYGGDSDSAVIQSLADTVSRYGMPFIAEYADLSALAARLEERWSRNEDAAYRWPVALWRLGLTEEAAAGLTAVEDSLRSRTDLAAHNLRAFVTWLGARMEASG